MTYPPVEPRLIMIAVFVLPLLSAIVRCSSLLVGLLAALSKAAQDDRADIFREFALALHGRHFNFEHSHRLKVQNKEDGRSNGQSE
jgi:hypothetical protein